MSKTCFDLSAGGASDARLAPLTFIERFARDNKPTHAFAAATRSQWQRWHGELREKLTDALGLRHFGGWAGPLRVTEGPVEKFRGFTRRAFTLETAPGLFAPAFLLVPSGATHPRPAVLCSHGHGYGMNELVGLTEDGRPRRIGTGYQHDFAIQSVRAGFVTLTFDQFGFGRRRDFAFNEAQNIVSACHQPSMNALHFGLTTTAVRVWDAMRMVDFLQSRDEALAGRIAMVGISGGGLVTQFTAALDDRIRAACVSGYCNRYADCILSIHHCVDNYMPGLGLLADNDDVACLIAPRPLLIESGTEDTIFPIAATRAAVRKLRRCYKLLGASRMIETDLFEKDHQFSGDKTWKFFARHLESGR